ncbi:MAG: peptide deformylase [Patescibacteria group bacterium]|nr:peptide deformylase [Patescibacteria group bacterium]
MIWTINNKEQEKFLRRKAAEFDFNEHSKKEIRELIKNMRIEMAKAIGVGLSANQLGMDMRLFIAKVDNKQYSIFNPVITKLSKETIVMEEGCLSVPEIYGEVDRPEKITIEGFDANGKKIKIKAWGLLARVFQHETDHLNGVLFIDKAKRLRKYEKQEKNREL